MQLAKARMEWAKKGKSDCGGAQRRLMSNVEKFAAGAPEDAQWHRTYQRAAASRDIVVSQFMERTIGFGICDMPSVPLKDGMELGDIPQKEEDKAVALNYLDKGAKRSIYEDVTKEYAQECRERGLMVFSAFTIWHGEGADRKPRFL